MEKLSVFGFLGVFVNMTDREKERPSGIEEGREAITGLGFCFETTPTWARPRLHGRNLVFTNKLFIDIKQRKKTTGVVAQLASA